MKKVYIHVNVKETLRDELKKEADEKGISMNSYLNIIFSERKK